MESKDQPLGLGAEWRKAAGGTGWKNAGDPAPCRDQTHGPPGPGGPYSTGCSGLWRSWGRGRPQGTPFTVVVPLGQLAVSGLGGKPGPLPCRAAGNSPLSVAVWRPLRGSSPLQPALQPARWVCTGCVAGGAPWGSCLPAGRDCRTQSPPALPQPHRGMDGPGQVASGMGTWSCFLASSYSRLWQQYLLLLGPLFPPLSTPGSRDEQSTLVQARPIWTLPPSDLRELMRDGHVTPASLLRVKGTTPQGHSIREYVFPFLQGMLKPSDVCWEQPVASLSAISETEPRRESREADGRRDFVQRAFDHMEQLCLNLPSC